MKSARLQHTIKIREVGVFVDGSQISLIGIVITVALYIFFILRGINVYLLSASATALVGLFSGMDVLKLLLGPFMTAFVGFLKSYFLIFVSSALFGRFISDAGVAYSVGKTSQTPRSAVKITRSFWPHLLSPCSMRC